MVTHLPLFRDAVKFGRDTSLSFLFISSTVGVSRLMEAQMDLPRLLFSVGFKIFFIVTPQMFTFSLEYVENV